MNADVGFMQTASLHQRVGDQTALTADKGRSWGRFLAQDLDGSGKTQFDYSQKSKGFQLGRDFWIQASEGAADVTAANGKTERAGAMLHLTDSQTVARDRIRPVVNLQRDTGEIYTHAYGLGGYYTTIHTNGQYSDFTVHINKLRNKFSDSYGTKGTQDGTQLAVSAEHGRPLTQIGSWTLEGQGQATLLHTRYKAFGDGYSNIDSDNFNALRGRLGLRIHNGAATEGTRYYGIGNIVHDLIKTKTMAVSDKNNSQRVIQVGETFDQTYVEFGAGVQGKVSESTWTYADVRYEMGVKNRKDTLRLSVGLKF